MTTAVTEQALNTSWSQYDMTINVVKKITLDTLQITHKGKQDM